MDTLTPGIYTTGDGSHSVISEQFKESYHSRHGALKESLHVFIEAGLKAAATDKKSLKIIEIGLGTGLNAWLTLLETHQNEALMVEYTGLEPFPLDQEMVETLNYPAVHNATDHQDVFHQIHTAEWEVKTPISNQLSLIKIKKTLADFQTTEKFDICYFDAFAPNAQPELWNEDVFRQIYDFMAPEGIFVTYCAKGTVKRGLKAVGFEVETLPGPPGKREMTRARKG